MATRDEVLRLVVQTAGDSDLKALSDAVTGVGTAAGISDPEVKKLVDELVSLNQTSKAVDQLTALNAQLDTNSQKLEAAKAKVADFQKQIADSGTPTKQLSDALNTAQKSVVSLTASQDKLQTRADGVAASLTTQGVDVKNLATVHTQLGQQVAKTADEIARLAKEQSDAAEKSKRHAEAVQEFRAKLLELVSVAAAAELALKAIEFGKEQFSAAADVEQIFSRIKALAGDAAEGIGELDKKVEEAGKAVNVSTEASANALAALVKNGLTLDGAYSALIPTLQLAKNAQVDIGTASASVTQSIKLFGLQTDDAAHIVDVLTVASKGSAGGIGDFSDSLQKIAPAARQAGLDFEETATVLGTLTKGGQSAGNAAKGLKSVLDELRDPSSKLRVELSNLGDNTGNFQKAITTAGAAGARTNEVLKALSGSGKTVFELFLQQGPAGFNATRAAIENANGAAKTFSDQLDKNLNGQFTRLKNAVNAAGEALLKPILKPLQDEFEKLAGKINEFAETDDFKKLQAIIGEFADKAVKAFDKFVTGIDWKEFTKNTTEALGGASKKLGDIADTVSKTADAINVAATAIGLAYHAMGVTIDAAVGVVATGVDQVTSNLKAVAPVLKVFTVGLIDVDNALTDVGDSAKDVADSSFKNMQEHIEGVTHSATDLKTELTPAGEAIKKVGEAAHDAAPKVEEASEGITKFGVTAKTAAEIAAQSFALAVPIITDAVEDIKQKSTKASLDLENAFTSVGIKSQFALKKLADDAETQFKRVNAAQDGTNAKLVDAQNEFLAYAARRLEAVKNLDVAAQQEAEQNLLVQASALRLGDRLDKLVGSILGVQAAFKGDHGGGLNLKTEFDAATTASQKTAESLFTVANLAGKSASDISGIGKAAGKNVGEVNSMKDAIEGAANSADNAFDVGRDHLQSYSFALDGLSQKAIAAYNAAQKYALEAVQGQTAFGEQYARAYNDIVGKINTDFAQQKRDVAELAQQYAGLSQNITASATDTAASLQKRADALAQFSDALRNGTSQFSLLDQQSLAGLQAQIDATRQKTQSLADAAKAAGDQLKALNQQLQDQVDASNNNQAAIEDRRYQTQLQQIKDLEEKTGAAGLQDANQALALAQKVHDDALLKIKQQADAQAAANAKTQQQAQQQSAPANANHAVAATVNLVVTNGGGIADNLTNVQLQSLAQRMMPYAAPILLEAIHAAMVNNT